MPEVQDPTTPMGCSSPSASSSQLPSHSSWSSSSCSSVISSSSSSFSSSSPSVLFSAPSPTSSASSSSSFSLPSRHFSSCLGQLEVPKTAAATAAAAADTRPPASVFAGDPAVLLSHLSTPSPSASALRRLLLLLLLLCCCCCSCCCFLLERRTAAALALFGSPLAKEDPSRFLRGLPAGGVEGGVEDMEGSSTKETPARLVAVPINLERGVDPLKAPLGLKPRESCDGVDGGIGVSPVEACKDSGSDPRCCEGFSSSEWALSFLAPVVSNELAASERATSNHSTKFPFFQRLAHSMPLAVRATPSPCCRPSTHWPV
mmetsp:Transcript_80307/g.167235  ORF Transcript_80307/g.167235 Transcript_80307/m.167235 type:complete len:317 (+) Transcript_80307:285-1235(+)